MNRYPNILPLNTMFSQLGVRQCHKLSMQPVPLAQLINRKIWQDIKISLILQMALSVLEISRTIAILTHSCNV